MAERTFTPSSRTNACPICGRTKDSDCRLSDDLILCRIGATHRPPTEKPGTSITASDGSQWICRGRADGDWIQFALAGTNNHHRPRTHRQPRPTPFRIESPAAMAAIAGSIDLARLPGPLPEPPPDHLPSGYQLPYSPTQRVVVKRDAQGKKFPVQHLTSNGDPATWTTGAGPDPWPLWHQAEAVHHGPGYWITEAEGEKCADWLRAGGLIAISQPGHAHKPEQIQARYRALQQAGIRGVVFLADHDEQGRQRAGQSLQAAAAIGLPLLVLHAGDVWPGLPAAGSIDDAPGTPAERVAAIQQAIPDAIAQQQQEEGKVELLTGAALLRFINENYTIEWNELKQRSVVNGVLPRGEDKKLFYLDISNRFPSVKVKKEEAQDSLDYLARQNPFNPVQRYVDSLKEKAERGEIQLLKLADIASKGFGLDDWLSQLLLAHKLVQHLKRGLQPGYKADEMAILQGGQGSYKTESIKALSPDPTWCVTATEVKDTDEWKFLLKISQSWFFLLDECDKFLRGKDSSTLKSIITNGQDSYAKKGLNEVDDYARPSTLWGTTNQTELFNDHTGVRRWWLMQQAEGRRANPGWIQRNRDSIWATVYTWAMWGLDGHLPEGSEVQRAAEARAWAATYALEGADKFVAILSAIPIQDDGLPLPVSQQALILQATQIDVVRLLASNKKQGQDLIGDVTRTVTAGNFRTHDGQIRWEKGRRRIPGHSNPVAAFFPKRVAAAAAKGQQQLASFQSDSFQVDPIPRVPTPTAAVPTGWNGQTLWQETVLTTLFQRVKEKEELKQEKAPVCAEGCDFPDPQPKVGTSAQPLQNPSAGSDLPVPTLGTKPGTPSEQTTPSAHFDTRQPVLTPTEQAANAARSNLTTYRPGDQVFIAHQRLHHGQLHQATVTKVTNASVSFTPPIPPEALLIDPTDPDQGHLQLPQPLASASTTACTPQLGTASGCTVTRGENGVISFTYTHHTGDTITRTINPVRIRLGDLAELAGTDSQEAAG
jgi:hypothetical protein